ncbi:10467_t:CDS:1, partial [Acaulospora morrowiae]
EISSSGPGDLHSLEIKFEGEMKKAAFLELNEYIHKNLTNVAATIPLKKVEEYQKKLRDLPTRFEQELLDVAFSAAVMDTDKMELDREHWTPTSEITKDVASNVLALKNYVIFLKNKAATPKE